MVVDVERVEVESAEEKIHMRIFMVVVDVFKVIEEMQLDSTMTITKTTEIHPNIGSTTIGNNHIFIIDPKFPHQDIIMI